jgi:hypothetical protein
MTTASDGEVRRRTTRAAGAQARQRQHRHHTQGDNGIMSKYRGAYSSKYRGCIFQNRWMSMHRIPPVPLWTVGWLLDLIDLLKGREMGGGGDEPGSPF